MLPADMVAGIHCLVPENPMSFPPTNFSMIQTTTPTFHFNGFFSNLPNSHYSSTISNNSSTSDEADDEHHQLGVADERKQRRMISNRESARRSRMRKQKHLDELWSQVIRQRTENQSLMERLNRLSECHERVLKENSKLKEEVSELREMLAGGLQIGSPYNAFRELESSDQSITSSVDFLH